MAQELEAAPSHTCPNCGAEMVSTRRVKVSLLDVAGVAFLSVVLLAVLYLVWRAAPLWAIIGYLAIAALDLWLVRLYRKASASGAAPDWTPLSPVDGPGAKWLSPITLPLAVIGALARYFVNYEVREAWHCAACGKQGHQRH